MPTVTTAERTSRSAIRIRSIVAVPLFGDSPKGGWSAEIKPEDSIHALVELHTAAGLTGYGSVFTASLKNCTKTPFGWAAAAA